MLALAIALFGIAAVVLYAALMNRDWVATLVLCVIAAMFFGTGVFALTVDTSEISPRDETAGDSDRAEVSPQVSAAYAATTTSESPSEGKRITSEEADYRLRLYGYRQALKDTAARSEAILGWCQAENTNTEQFECFFSFGAETCSAGEGLWQDGHSLMLEGRTHGYLEDSYLGEWAQVLRDQWLSAVRSCETYCRTWRKHAKPSWEGYLSWSDSICAGYHAAHLAGEEGYPGFLPDSQT